MDALPITSAAPGEIRRFNLVCAAIALAWITGSLFWSIRYAKPEPLEKFDDKLGEIHEFHDFSQFYMGGLVAKRRAWDALYPVPKPLSVNSPGEWEESDSRPTYSQLAREAGVPEHQSRFIQPPPFAVMMEPFALLKYPHAKKAWNLLMCLCAWSVAVLAGRSLRAAWGRPTRGSGIVTLLVAFSPLTFETLRLMNVTPFIALMTGLAITGLLSQRSEGGAAALVVGALSKYASAVLLPLYVAMRKWSALVVMALVAAAILAATYYLTNRGPFDAFWHEMVPTFGRVHTDKWNRSFYAVLLAIDNGRPLHGGLLWTGRIAQWGTLLALLWVLFTRPRQQFERASNVFAAAACLLGWFLIFSPILWDHYLFYLAPLWGWLVWEARRSVWRAILVIAAIGYQSLPELLTGPGTRVARFVTFLDEHRVAAPESLLTLLTVLAIVAIGVVRLFTIAPEEEVEEDADLPATFMSARHFNLACYAVTALFLAAFVTHYVRSDRGPDGYKDTGDFAQFYMGGVMAQRHAWPDLYPIPKPTSVNNAGLKEDSDMRPAYAQEAERRGVGNQLRFIQPPPVALMLWPIAHLSFSRAFVAWLGLLALCGWLLGYVAGQVYRELFGRETRVSGAMMLLVACSPLMLHAIVVANMTIIVALMLGIAALELTRRRDVTSALAITLGGVLKYATLALLPLAVAMRRWTLVILTILFAAALFGGTAALTRQGPFLSYARDIAPTLHRPHTISTNQSAAGMLMRLRGWDGKDDATIKPLPPALTWAVRGVQLLVFAALLWLLFRRPAHFWDEPANVFAASAALLCWLLVFAPIYWEHYPLYLAPLWAWLVWESRRSWLMLLLTVCAVALMWAPVTAYPEYVSLREPFNSHVLAGTLLMMVAAIVRLLGPGADEEPGDEPRFELATPFEGGARDEPVVPYGDEAVE